MKLIDVRHLGRERVIGAWLVDGCLVDPGPTSSLDALLAGLDGEVPERILLTHIHLDHAGAAGTLARRWPDVEVWVHERGAPHLAAPEKLVKSATRLYGDAMDRLWGEIVPVPRERLRVLGDQETIGGWRVAYTPGHASHHVSYLHAPSATAFCGDVAGVRITPDGPVLAPTPPPDIDLALWRASIDRIAAWNPDRLAIAHFGDHGDVAGHLGRLRERLTQMTAWAQELGDAAAFAERLRAEVAAETDERTAAAYEQGMPPDQQFAGMERALRGVTPAAMSQVIERPRTSGPDSGTGGAWRVIVLNDDHNTFDHVANSLARYIPGMSVAMGYALADRIHTTGQAIVWSGHQEQAELYWEQLRDAGLTMAPLERD